MSGAWRRVLHWLLAAVALATMAGARAELPSEGDITLQARYWVDPTGSATIDRVANGAAQLQPMDRHRAFPLGDGALWLRFDLPALDPAHRWYLLLTGAAFVNRASLFVPEWDGSWHEQRAGDHVSVAQWTHPNYSPLFTVPNGGGTAWLRLENTPAPTAPYVQLLTADSLEFKRQWTFLLIGGYVGFGLLVLFVGLMHGRLYGDRAFDVYCIYVACMLLFQLAFTGLGGLFLWPHHASLNDAAPGLFVLLMSGSGIWFVREATALRRHNRFVDRYALAFAATGIAFAPVYALFNTPFAYKLLNVYGLLSVITSISLCAWSWHKGEKYSGWLLLGLLPIHLSYPFPALRAAGVLPDSGLTQYAVLIGSALEIPALLYILHWRAKEFSENRARMRVLDTTDPLTGLTILPVFLLRLRDALKRVRRTGQHAAVLLVDLANHAEIVESEGREAGDRALVVAASRLSAVLREVDTVCRVDDTRFVILQEGPQPDEGRKLLAQHLVARGLEPVPQLPPHLALRFRVVSARVPDRALEAAAGGAQEERHILERLGWAMDHLVAHPRRVVRHLEPGDSGQTEAPSDLSSEPAA